MIVQSRTNIITLSVYFRLTLYYIYLKRFNQKDKISREM